MNVGNIAALVTIISALIGGYYKIKKEQDSLNAHVNQRITKLETDLEWVVKQTRDVQAAMTEGYIGEQHERRSQRHATEAERKVQESD